MKKILHLCLLMLVIVGATACGGGSDKHTYTYFSTSSSSSSLINSSSSISNSSESSTPVQQSSSPASLSSVESSSSVETSSSLASSSSVDSSSSLASSSSSSMRQISVTTLWPREDENAQDFGNSSTAAYVTNAEVFYSVYTIDEIGIVRAVEPYHSQENDYTREGWAFEYPGEPSFFHVVTATRNYGLLPAVGDNIFDAQFKLVAAPLIGNDIVLSPFSTAILSVMLPSIDPIEPMPQGGQYLFESYFVAIHYLNEKLNKGGTGMVLAQHIEVARLVITQTLYAQYMLSHLDSKARPTTINSWHGLALIEDADISPNMASIFTPQNDKLLILGHDINGVSPTPDSRNHFNQHVYLGDGLWGERESIRQLTREASESLFNFAAPNGKTFSITSLSIKDVSNVNIMKLTHALPFTPVGRIASRNAQLEFSPGAEASVATLSALSDGYNLIAMTPYNGICDTGGGEIFNPDLDETNCVRVPTLHYSATTQTFEPGYVTSLDEITYVDGTLETEGAALVKLYGWNGRNQDLYAQFIDNGTDKILRIYRFDREAIGSQFTHVHDARWAEATVDGLNGGASTTVYTVDRLNHLGIWFWGYDIFFTMNEGYLRQGGFEKAYTYNALLLNPIALNDWVGFMKSTPPFMHKTYSVNDTEYRFTVGDYGGWRIEETIPNPETGSCRPLTSTIDFYYVITPVEDDNSVSYHLQTYGNGSGVPSDLFQQNGSVIITPNQDGGITITTPTGSVTGFEMLD